MRFEHVSSYRSTVQVRTRGEILWGVKELRAVAKGAEHVKSFLFYVSLVNYSLKMQ